MAQLSSVIGSILRDIVSAQHEANLYSLSLGDSYGKDGKAKDFQLPNVMVSDMELDLKYGVKSAEFLMKFVFFFKPFKEVFLSFISLYIRSHHCHHSDDFGYREK